MSHPGMTWGIYRRLVCFLPLLLVGPRAPAQELLDSPLVALDPLEAVREGQMLLQIRPRYVWVEQDGRSGQARWGSVRTAIGWKTLEYRGLSVVAEGINLSRFASDNAIDYRSTPAYTGVYQGSGWTYPYVGPYPPGYYPLVQDPNVTDVNRLYAQYTGLAHTSVRLGRQAVSIDNQRFVGDYDDGPLPQLFNGLTVENTPLANARLLYGYYARVRNAYGVDWQTRINAFNVRYEPLRAVRLAAYAYLQDQASTGSLTGFSDNSNRIAGARAWGTLEAAGTTQFFYSLELAQQRPYADGDPRIRAAYQRVGAGARLARASLRVEWERLGSNGGVYGFQTPLGSTQLFTGRADIFATTPAAGLRDLRGVLSGEFEKASLRLEFHSFRSDDQGLDLGREWDVGVAYALTPRLVVSADYADYQAPNTGAGFRSTQKAWISARYIF
jgi:hypothetical protein